MRLSFSLFPEEMFVDLLRANQVPQLLEARKSPILEDSGVMSIFLNIRRVVAPRAARVPRTFETGQMLPNLFKRRP